MAPPNMTQPSTPGATVSPEPEGHDYSKFAANNSAPTSPAGAEQQAQQRSWWTKRRIFGVSVLAVILLAVIGVVAGLFLAPKSSSSQVEQVGGGSSSTGGSGSTGSGSSSGSSSGSGGSSSGTPAANGPPYKTGRSAPKNCSLAPLADRVTAPGINRLEPPSTAAPYIGFSLEWSWDRPLPMLRRIGNGPAIIGGFLQSYAPGTWDTDAFNLYIGAAVNMTQDGDQGMVRPIVNLALMPAYTLDKLNAATMTTWAKEFARVNYELGVPIMLRFAHEFNGNWNEYAQKPAQFIAKWRQFTNIVRQYTNMTAMVWAPNVAVGYPYGSSQFSAQAGTADFDALDTNKDGKVDQLDDPYTPYWPGAEYVDWVAVSLYWFGGKWPEVFNSPPPADYVSATIRGVSDESKNYNQPPWNFHDMFAKRYNKPMAIPESGVSFYYTDSKGKVDPGIGELGIKRAWWRQTYNKTMFAQLPALRGVVHFEESKVEERGNVSYLITVDSTIRSAFLEDLKANPMTWDSDIVQWECDGRVTHVGTPRLQKRVLRSEF